VQDLDSQPAAVETKPAAPSGLKIEMPKLDIAATSDAAEPQRSARDFTAREREVAKPALALTGVAALTARGAKDKKEAAAAAGESAAPPALSLNKLSELKGRDPDAPMATPRKDAPETSRRKKAEMPNEPASTEALVLTAAAGPAAAPKPDGTIVQDLDSQPAAVETKPAAPSGLKIEMPKLDIAATSDAAEPQRSARDFSAREREVAKPALALTGVAALTARGAKDKKEAAAAAAAAVPPPPPPPPVQTPAPAPVSASETSPRGSISRMFGFGSKPSAAAAAPSFAAESAAAGPVVKLTRPVADLKLSELKGRDPDAPLATPRKDAPETSRRKKAGMPDEPASTVASSDEATKQENQPWAQPQGQEHQRV
jgi:phage tail protein X